MKSFLVIAAVLVLVVIAWLLTSRNNRVVADTGKMIAWFKENAMAYEERTTTLAQKISLVDADSMSVKEAREALLECRLQYKRIALFIEFYFPEQAMILNGPPVAEIESGMNEYRDPAGMQVIEACLFEDHPSKFKSKMLEQVGVIQRSIENLLPAIRDFKMSADDAWYAISLELIRVYTLYITGYDAPELKSGILEAASSLDAIDSVLLLLHAPSSINNTVHKAKSFLQAHEYFDSFDRLYFITTFAMPLQKELNSRVEKQPESFNARSSVNFAATSLFASNGIDKNHFPASEVVGDSVLVALGRRLFSEPMLSGNNERSCSTCHAPSTFFSDRLGRNKNRELTGDLPRNTPSLLYAVYQFNQFWDGRVRSLPEQAIAVMNDTVEMKGPGQAITEKIDNDKTYKALFSRIWKQDTVVTEEHIAAAVAAYIRTLTPFRSSFDRYITGDKSALSQEQKRGFNIFMGKAMCGTCHFAPLFNGLLPPLYNITEFEILGTPVDDNLGNPRPDTDTGQARVIVGMPQGAFKTPTVRNAEETSPYMHNGGFKSLDSVIEFYNKGGGEGLGLQVPGQTLSSKPLNLDSIEKADLLDFMRSLTDN